MPYFPAPTSGVDEARLLPASAPDGHTLVKTSSGWGTAVPSSGGGGGAPYSPGTWQLPEWATSFGSKSGGNGTLHLVPVLIRTTVSVDGIGAQIVGTPPTTGVLRLGLYAATEAGAAGQLLLEAGSVAATTNAERVITFAPISLTSGLVYVGVVVQDMNAITNLRCISTTGWTPIPLPSADTTSGYHTSLTKVGYTTGGLPADLTGLSTSKMTGTAPALPLRVTA